MFSKLLSNTYTIWPEKLIYEGRSLVISPDLLPMVGKKPTLAQLLVFLYKGFFKGCILLQSFDAAM